MNIELNKIYHGDCLEVMKSIKDKSIDMILCDLPYGTTACKWDVEIPFEPLWKQYLRIIKDKSAIILTSIQPFTSFLINSNIKYFKCEYIWQKTKATNYIKANEMPMKYHENILLFGKHKINYYPIMIKGKPYIKEAKSESNIKCIFKDTRKIGSINVNDGYRFPSSIIRISNDNHFSLHPTQKPVPLFEYLIKTYTKENEVVLDNCIGSGTTAIACINTNRQYIGIEKDDHYFEVCNERIRKHLLLRKYQQKWKVYK